VEIPRLWVGVAEAAQATGKKKKTIYEQIRIGTFPFRIRRAGTSILVSAVDLGLVGAPPIKPEKIESEQQPASAGAKQ